MMKHKKNTVKDLLQDETFHEFVKNSESTEGRYWAKRIENEPALKKTAEKARGVIRSLKFDDLSLPSKEASVLWDRIKTDTVEQPVIPIIKEEGNRIGLKEYLKIAAVLIPLIALSAVMYLQKDKELQIETISTIVKECPNGRKMLVNFPDGSRAKLNAGSKISFKSQFDSEFRIVELEGEGFFEIQKDINRPFIVLTKNLQTQVLGTSFNVRAYPEETETSVVVRTGLVSVGMSPKDNIKPKAIRANSMLLNPAEMATYSKVNKGLTKENDVDVEELIAWNSGVLIFKNASAEEVVSSLERWYGVEFEIPVGNKIKDGFSGRFENESLRYVLDGISYVSHFDYEITKNKVEIK